MTTNDMARKLLPILGSTFAVVLVGVGLIWLLQPRPGARSFREELMARKPAVPRPLTEEEQKFAEEQAKKFVYESLRQVSPQARWK